ncbi:MAG TPA: 30S ribosome-binding factor RbfA [Anaerolineaceae bacterium]|jgi:ribosome-binding factor A
MPSNLRLQRIADRIQQEISELVLLHVSDPRLEGIFITGAKVDRELSYADVFVSAVEGAERSAEILEGLHSASGYLRHELAARVELRVIPRLRFHWDPTPENADHIERLLASLRTDGTPEPPADENGSAEDD